MKIAKKQTTKRINELKTMMNTALPIIMAMNNKAEITFLGTIDLTS
ncbi:MAG: hypothetical protein ABIJ91_01185 [Candidatus Kuenenbacteria bacterium]